jgi:hypothetical protein
MPTHAARRPMVGRMQGRLVVFRLCAEAPEGREGCHHPKSGGLSTETSPSFYILSPPSPPHLPPYMDISWRLRINWRLFWLRTQKFFFFFFFFFFSIRPLAMKKKKYSRKPANVHTQSPTLPPLPTAAVFALSSPFPLPAVFDFDSKRFVVACLFFFFFLRLHFRRRFMGWLSPGACLAC